MVTASEHFRIALQLPVKKSIGHAGEPGWIFWSIANFRPYKLAQSVGQ
jgi:hypothetical protein